MSKSTLEASFDQALAEHGADLPAPEHQFPFAASLGRRFRTDRAWPAQRLLLELDGGTWSGGRHTSGVGFDSDSQKMALAAILGYRWMRFTSSMLKKDAAGCIDLLRRALVRYEMDPHEAA